MNSIIKTTEVTLDSKPKRTKNAKAVFCITDGNIYASTVDAANAIGVHNSSISMCCTGKVATVKGKRYCFVKDLTIHVLDVASEIKSLYADASIYRERKAKEEAERKRTERITAIKERREKLATEMDSLYAELMELENEGK